MVKNQLVVNESLELKKTQMAQSISSKLDKFKARLVAKRFSQVHGFDFFETFSPMVKPLTIRLIFTLALTNQWKLTQLDVSNDFMNSLLNKTLYMS